MPYATAPDVEARLGRTLTVLEKAQVEAWIEDIEEQIRVRIPNLDEAIAAGNPTSALVKGIVAGAAKRAADNPKGLKSITVALDDYSKTEVSAGTTAEILFITDDEWNLLLPGASGDAFTIRTVGADQRAGQWVHPDVWLPL
ncbi:Gp19/Gp15/Gp42 family protein [Arthrobacter agilis]|uniref:Gp19/Gp15/Gp42 family protein n=1 Tax=Arthrobacter agilis TaxID=37921 RepID=UPI00236620DD|nr:Gp19/Gp15/Gp42 family protein [Arthrobacter agilis]WDF34549.1 Gp19/Gp15/Gp42 family protein [Arthrobacter agilis]